MRLQRQSTKFSAQEVNKYHDRGYVFPTNVLDDGEVAEFRKQFDSYYNHYKDRLQKLPPNKHSAIYGHTHVFLEWVYRMVSHDKVLDAVESILGPNLLVWDTGWFAKMPGDNKFVSWHQDATYWGLHPPKVATAWVALSNSSRVNGCMRVIPGSHKPPLLPQHDTYDPQNALSRGQEIAVEVDEQQAVDIVLRPGQMSLHDIGIVHGSKANSSGEPRIGIAIRYIAPEVVQDGRVRQFGLLVRGEDKFGHFDLIDPPQDNDPDNNARQVESMQRFFHNIVPSANAPGRN